MFECQHRSQVIRHEEFWVTGSSWPTLAEAVAAMQRRLTPWAGEGRVRKLDEYRIVKTNARRKVIETYDTHGTQTDGFLVKPDPKLRTRKRQPVLA